MDPLESAQGGQAEVCLGNEEMANGVARPWISKLAAWISKHALAGALDGHE